MTNDSINAKLIEIQEKFNDIFRYQIDSSGRVGKISRQDFWSDIYVPRTNEETIFSVFLNSDCSLLFVTGMVGTGKSTFIRSMYENLRLCTGIIIDFEAHAERFSSVQEDEIEPLILSILRESMLNLLKENIKYMILDEKSEYVNYHYNPKLKVRNFEPDVWENPYNDYLANIEIFALAMQYLHADESISKFAYENSIIPVKKTTEFVKICKEKALADGKLLNSFADIFDWRRILELIRRIVDRNMPFVLTFDNIDAIKMSKIQRHFLEVLINLSNSANNSKSDGNIASLNPKPIKIVLNIRDENVTRINLSAAGTRRNMQMMLSENCKKLNNASEQVYVQKSKDFFYKVVEKRIEKAILLYAEPEMQIITTIIKNHVLDLEKLELKQGEEYINIRELSNESIRLMLDVISDLSFSIFGTVDRNELNVEYLNKSNHYVKGKLIHFLWESDTTKEAIQRIGDSIKNEHEYNNFCCSFRMCMTYLLNCTNHETTFEELKNDMLKWLEISEDTLKKSIFRLYNTGPRESEIITIYQDALILSASSINDESVIKLNSKGEQILSNTIKNIDFFGKLTEEKHGLIGKCLFEMMPEDALKYVEAIYKFVKNSFTYHVHFLQEKIYPRYVDLGHTHPFETFSRSFCVGKGFFTERVCDTHMSLIKKYINCVLMGRDSTLLVSKGDRVLLDEYQVPGFQPSHLVTDFGLSKLFRDNHVNKTLKDIFSYVKLYEDITSDLGKLKNYRSFIDNDIVPYSEKKTTLEKKADS